MRRRDAVIKNRDKLIEIIMRMSPENMRRTLQDFAVENYLAGYEESKEEFNKEKLAHWINIDETHSECDGCGAVFEIVSENGEANYCPNCGCRMVEPPERE